MEQPLTCAKHCCPDPVNVQVSGTVDQHRKISLLPAPEDRIYRGCMGLISCQGLSSALQVPDSLINCYRFEGSPTHNCTKLFEASGSHGHLHSKAQYTRQRLRTLQGWLALIYLLTLDGKSALPCPHFPRLVDRSSHGIPFACPQLTLTLMTDALALGWGAHLASLQMQGLWSSEFLALYITAREQTVVRMVCQVFLSEIGKAAC